jgi:hypothetical protein
MFAQYKLHPEGITALKTLEPLTLAKAASDPGLDRMPLGVADMRAPWLLVGSVSDSKRSTRPLFEHRAKHLRSLKVKRLQNFSWHCLCLSLTLSKTSRFKVTGETRVHVCAKGPIVQYPFGYEIRDCSRVCPGRGEVRSRWSKNQTN